MDLFQKQIGSEIVDVCQLNVSQLQQSLKTEKDHFFVTVKEDCIILKNLKETLTCPLDPALLTQLHTLAWTQLD